MADGPVSEGAFDSGKCTAEELVAATRPEKYDSLREWATHRLPLRQAVLDALDALAAE